MTKCILKYPVSVGENLIPMPQHAEVIHFGEDPMGQLCLWAITFQGDLTRARKFLAVGTGHQFPANAAYIGTCKQGAYMWHLMEVPSYG